MKRRDFLINLSAAAVGAATGTRAFAAGAPGKSIAEIQKDWPTLLAKGADVAQSTSPITKTEAEWKQSLREESFYVLRKEGTERPFSSPLNDEKRAGIESAAILRVEHRARLRGQHRRECRVRLPVDHPIIRLPIERAKVRRIAQYRW